MRRGVAVPLLLAAACGAPMQIFSSASDSAASVTWLAWFMIILSGLIFVGVMITMVAAFLRNRSRNAADVDLSDPGVRWLVWGGGVMPGVVLIALFAVALSAAHRSTDVRPVVTIHVTGAQWWWQLDYEFPNKSEHFRTANEIHVPAGEPVRLLLTSNDVIHSFWVPQLQGKLDLIPGDTNDLRLLVRKPGTYTGACAEFCGVQHTHMGITVIADDTTTFRQWTEGQLADGAAP